MLFVAELGMPNARLYKFGNTIFVIHPSEQRPEFGIFRALNADVAENFIKNSKQFTAKALEDGFVALKVQFSDPAILKLFKMIALDEQARGNTNTGYAVGKAKNGDYSITLVLDKQRMGQQ